MNEHGKRASGGRAAGEQGGEGRGDPRPRWRTWLDQLVPGGPLGYALAVLSLLIVGVCLYAASGLVRDLAQSGLSATGAAATGETTDLGQAPEGPGVVNELFQDEVPGGGGEELDQTRTADGAKVTLLRAYADADSVVVGFTVEDLEGGRRLGEYPAELQPGYGGALRLTDESGTEFGFDYVTGEVSAGPNSPLKGPQPNVMGFKTAGRIEPGAGHHFRLEMPLVEMPVTSPGKDVEAPGARPIGEPLVFSFEAPVQPATVVEVNRTATDSGVTLTLERVTDSPGQPEAVICRESQDGARGWVPTGEDLAMVAPIPVAGEGDCLRVPLSHPLDGPSSVTVERVELNPASDGMVVNGRWTFEFEMPGS